MNRLTGNMESILDQQISGFHQYSLEHPVHLTYVSTNMCRMLGCRQEELLNEYADLYGQMIHPEDREVYDRTLKKLAVQGQSLTVQYRIVLKDGSIKYIRDDLTSARGDDGTISAVSVLADITEERKASDNFSILSDTLGFLRYTCDKHPKVTYFNDEMLKILRFPEDDDLDQLEMYKENVYMMIPPEQRRKFSIFLKRVYSQNSPVSGELVVQRCDGTRARLQGWVTKCINEHGEEEFRTVCMDITEKYKSRKASEEQKYLKALTEVYDKIFEYDFSAKTVKCIHAEHSGTFAKTLNIPMHLEEATEHYLSNGVIGEDQDMMRQYFNDLFDPAFRESDSKPPQIRFRGNSSAGGEKTYSGIYIKMEPSVGLFCVRTMDSDVLRSENLSLRNINEMMMKFSDGITAFQVDGDKVKPLYGSDNICSFFGYSKEEWEDMAGSSHSIREFTSRCGVAYEEFINLLRSGEAEFTYMDLKSGMPQQIRAVCSDMFSGDTGSKYVMLYKDRPGEAAETAGTDPGQPVISIRTFGYFDVFVDGNPIAFRNKKSKELFALLVDRRGGFVNSEEAISFLWEDEPVSAVTQARYRKVAMRLKNILEEYGVADIIETVDGKRRVVVDKVQCDLYDYLSQKEEFAHLFKGSYLTNYSWGENTLGELYSETI